MIVQSKFRAPVTKAVVALALAATTLPAAAEAAEVNRPFTGRINVEAAAGEVNRIRISDDGTGFVRIRDEVGLRDSTVGCEQLSTLEVRCEVARGTAIATLVGDRDDRVEVASTAKVGIEGAAGNDTYAGGLAAGASDVLYIGGEGVDTVSYADAGARVDADLGDGPGDGRAGDLDDITDAETIIGSRFGDRLVTQRARRQVGVTLDGGAGDDTLSSGAGRDVLTGGAGIDTISGLGEVDRILAQDRDRDNIDCGSGAPDEALVSLVGEGSIIGCEKVFPVRTATNNGGLVGTPRLTPAALRLAAGETTRLRLSWRHPRGWRQLRKIELSLHDRDHKVGQIVIRPRAERIAAYGAVELMRNSSRVAREGKTVSARLALRLNETLAGQDVRVEVEAVDVHGRRQVVRRAGSIRITD